MAAMARSVTCVNKLIALFHLFIRFLEPEGPGVHATIEIAALVE